MLAVVRVTRVENIMETARRRRTSRVAMRGDNAKECRLQAKHHPLQSSGNITKERKTDWEPEEVRECVEQ